ncbi:hypothetical protein B7463_g1571, partial [Scytalidium lignicola]
MYSKINNYNILQERERDKETDRNDEREKRKAANHPNPVINPLVAVGFGFAGIIPAKRTSTAAAFLPTSETEGRVQKSRHSRKEREKGQQRDHGAALLEGDILPSFFFHSSSSNKSYPSIPAILYSIPPTQSHCIALLLRVVDSVNSVSHRKLERPDQHARCMPLPLIAATCNPPSFTSRLESSIEHRYQHGGKKLLVPFTTPALSVSLSLSPFFFFFFAAAASACGQVANAYPPFHSSRELPARKLDASESSIQP